MSTKRDILIIEDEPPIRRMLAFSLSRSGFASRETETVAGAWQELTRKRPDLLILDWMLPDKTGINFLTKLRNNPHYENLPVIMLTARAEESSKLRGLDAGADDYITKPFSPRELIARIKTVLKRYPPAEDSTPREPEPLVRGELELNQSEHTLKIAGQAVRIGPLEFKLLYYLAQTPNKVYSREHLLDKVWGQKSHISDRTVDVHIRRVRKVLENNGYANWIQSIRGVGYKFTMENTRGQREE